MDILKVAVIKESPVFLDKEKTIKKSLSLIEEASNSGAKLIVFLKLLFQAIRIGCGD